MVQNKNPRIFVRLVGECALVRYKSIDKNIYHYKVKNDLNLYILYLIPTCGCGISFLINPGPSESIKTLRSLSLGTNIQGNDHLLIHFLTFLKQLYTPKNWLFILTQTK